MSSSSPAASPRTSFRELDTEFLTRQAKIWIEKVLDKTYDDEKTVADLLADGEILFEISKLVGNLMQKKYASVIDSPLSLEATAFGKQSGKYVPYSRVDAFLKICKKLGLTGVDLFSPPDAVEKRDVRRVCLCIRALSNKARSQHLDLPDFDIITHFAFMPTDMVEGMQKYLQQIWYSMSNEDFVTGLEGSRKSNEPISTGMFEILSQEPDNAESNLDRAISEVGCATIESFSVSPRSPPFKHNGWSSQMSTPIKNTLTEVNTLLTPVNDDYQEVNEVSRNMDTFISDAVTRNLEKSFSLNVKKSLDEVYDTFFPKDGEENKYIEDPVIHTANGHLGNSMPSKFDDHFVGSIHKDLIDISGLLHSELSFFDFKRDNDHVENGKDIKANGMHVVCTPKEFLPRTNANMQINIPSKIELSTGYGVHHPNSNAPEECAHSSSVSSSHGIKQGTDDLEVKSTNITKAKTVEVGPTKGIKLCNFNAGPESTLKGDHVEFYSKSASGVISSNIISVILLNSYHIDNHNINLPKTEHLDVEYANNEKSDNDMLNADAPKADGVDDECMTTEASLVTINPLPTPVLMNRDAKGDGNAASLSISHCILQGAANSREVYIDVLKKEEAEVGPINKLKLCTKNAGKEDSMFNDSNILTVDVDQCVNKAKSDVVCEVIPEEDYADIVSASGPNVDSMKSNYTVVTEESVVNVGSGLEEDNVDNNFIRVQNSDVVNVDSSANSRRGYSSYAIATEQDSAVDAGNVLEAVIDDVPKKLLKSEALDSAAGRKIDNINDLAIAEVDPLCYVDGLEADKIDIDSINALKSNIVDAVSVASKQSNSMESRVVSEEDSFFNDAGNNALKIDNVYHDYTNVVKSDDIHVDSVMNKKIGNMDFSAVTSEDSVVIIENALVADNVDNSNKDVLKSENIAAADSAMDMNLVDSNYMVDSATKMKTEYNKYSVVTEKDSVIHVDSELEADTVDDNSIHLPKPEVIGVDSAANMETGDIYFAVVTEEDCVANAGNGFQIANVHERSMKVQSLEVIDVDSAMNMEPRDKGCPFVNEADSVVNNCELEECNINNCALETKIFEANSPSKTETTDIECAVMTEKDNIVNQGNGFKRDNVNSDFKNLLVSETADVESAMNMNGVSREEDSVDNVGHGLEAETIENECKGMSNIESVNILSSKSRKIGNDLRDNLANLPDEISVNTDRSHMTGGDDMDTDYFSTKRFKQCQASDENDALIVDLVKSQLHTPVISDHGNGNEENSNKIDITTPKRDESEGKIRSKLNKKKIWVSVAACGIAVIGTAMMYIQRWNRKSEECEIKEGDTLAGISKKVGKPNWRELVLINPEIRDPDLNYPGQRLTLK